MKGRVTQLSRGRLCGSIQAADGQTLFFHGRDLDRVRYNDLEIGDPVTFDLIDDPISGNRAAKIRVTKTARPRKAL